MVQVADELGADMIRVPLTAVPSNLDQHTDLNARWNLLTVSLMVRAGALAWDFSLDELPADSDSPVDDRGWMTVRILGGDHLSPDFWHEVVESVRTGDGQRIAPRTQEPQDRSIRSKMRGGTRRAQLLDFESPQVPDGVSAELWGMRPMPSERPKPVVIAPRPAPAVSKRRLRLSQPDSINSPRGAGGDRG